MHLRFRSRFKVSPVSWLVPLLAFYISGCAKSNCGTTASALFNNADKQFMDQESQYNSDEAATAALALSNGGAGGRNFAQNRLAEMDSARQLLKAAAVSYSVFLSQAPDVTFANFQQRWGSESGLAFDTAYLGFEIARGAVESARLQGETTRGQDLLLLEYCRTRIPLNEASVRVADSLLLIAQHTGSWR